MSQADATRENWGSRMGVILAVMGSAVGLGNFLRFPGLAARYDGGAFMIPYFIAFLLLGLPIAWVEWSMGRYGGRRGFNSVPGIFRVIWNTKASPYFGVIGMVVPVLIYMYYVYVEAWCLGYAVRYLFGGLNPEGTYEAAFNTFAGKGANGAAFAAAGQNFVGSSVFYLIICFILNFVLIYRGLTKGIEWFCKWAMPALIVCALVVLVRVLTLPANPVVPDQNILNGLGYMWNPSTKTTSFAESIANPEMWLAAAGQIFFSLSVGYGIIITYASYMRKDDDIALSCLTAAAGNEFCEVALGGMITIPAAFVFLGFDFLQKIQGNMSSFELGFVALPNVFDQMPLGNFAGFLFFFLLFLAAVTSSISMLQPTIALLEEGLGLKRSSSVTLLGFITAIGSAFVVYFSANSEALNTFDFWAGTVGIYVLAMFEVIIFGWVLGIDRGFAELERGAEIRIPRIFRFIIKFVSPVYLAGVFAAWAYGELFGEKATLLHEIRTNIVVQLSIGFMVLVISLFSLLVAQSVRRWDKLEGISDRGIEN